MLCLALLAAASALVDVHTMNPRILLDIRYATTNNFTHRKLYEDASCQLRESTARKLDAAEREVEKLGLRLKVFDCYRPLAVQRKLWAAVPDERYVADPAKGSRHNRGAAVDLTLVTAGGDELEMPTGYDDFTERAHRDYEAVSKRARRNRALLERVMVKHGFVGLATEWWHFDDREWDKCPVE